MPNEPRKPPLSDEQLDEIVKRAEARLAKRQEAEAERAKAEEERMAQEWWRVREKK